MIFQEFATTAAKSVQSLINPFSLRRSELTSASVPRHRSAPSCQGLAVFKPQAGWLLLQAGWPLLQAGWTLLRYHALFHTFALPVTPHGRCSLPRDHKVCWAFRHSQYIGMPTVRDLHQPMLPCVVEWRDFLSFCSASGWSYFVYDFCPGPA